MNNARPDVKVALIQMNSQSDKDANIAMAEALVAQAAEDKPDLVVLPEYWAMLGEGPAEVHASAEEFPDGPAYQAMQGMARRHGITLHGGSIVERSGNAYHNTTVVFGPDGEERARYRKIHLFDVDVPGGLSYRESETIAGGDEVVTYDVAGKTVGCSICYDIRFPELFRALRDKGADIIVLPAAFTLMTGKDHWELLARARAIETQTHFVAVGQFGTHAGGKKACYGHSMVIDPWGHIVAQVGDHVGTVTARIDDAYKEKVRSAIPVHNHHVL
jgi:deaminated glutathione amidase